MPTYVYTGRDFDGKLLTGRRLAQTADSLSNELAKEGITPIKIILAADDVSLVVKINKWLESRKINVDELAIFARQMNTLCKTGVPITSALRQLAETARTIRMSNTLYGIVERLEAGQDLAKAMQNYPQVFTPIMLSMIRVGQSGGHLDEAFLRLNQYLELEGTALKRAKAALRYPMFVFGSLIAALVIVNVFVIPTFASVFAMSHTKLPLETVILMGMSNFIRHNWILLCVLIVATIFGIRRYLKTPQGQLKWSQYQLQIPKVGSILRRIVLLRFAQSFSVVINSGIPLLEGIRLVSDTVNNEYAKQEILAIGDSIEHGRTLTQAVATSHLFTPLELQMLMVGEETGELGLLLEQIADFYRREVDYDLKRLNDIIEPILLIGLAVIIMILAFAVYLPIWNMVKLVHN